MKSFFKFFWRGLAMGAADVVPGVSGGTIAFITGIYERFIQGINNFFLAIKNVFAKKSFKPVLTIDFTLFIPLVLGIGTAFYFGSKFIPGLMERYLVEVLSLFIGLILGSVVVLNKRVKKKNSQTYLFGFAGLVFGALIGLLIPLAITPTLPYLFFVGFLAISAMLLPGISGSFIVLILGQYEFLLDALHLLTEQWKFVLSFALGATLGLLVFSRTLTWLFKKYHDLTLFFLAGLMLGSLTKLIKEVMIAIPSSTELLIGGIAIIIGYLLVTLLEKHANLIAQ